MQSIAQARAHALCSGKFQTPPSKHAAAAVAAAEELKELPCKATVTPLTTRMIMAESTPTSATAAASATPSNPPASKLASRYRGATVEDLDPPSALSCNPDDPISTALMQAFERDYTHLTVISPENRALLGYLSMPHLRILLDTGKVQESDSVEKAMVRFKRKGKVYKVITMDTPLEELEAFFNGDGVGSKQDFAVVTDERRRFVLGVATRTDLEEFARRRPA